jgi:hypothetical protein
LGDILRVVVFHHLALKKDLSTSLPVAADQCIDACNKVGRKPMLKRKIATKIGRKLFLYVFFIVNDCAERAIALMATYNQTLAKGEKQKKDVLQVVENNHKRVKTTSKKEQGTYETL